MIRWRRTPPKELAGTGSLVPVGLDLRGVRRQVSFLLADFGRAFRAYVDQAALPLAVHPPILRLIMDSARRDAVEDQAHHKSAVVVDEWALFRHGIATVLAGIGISVAGEAEGFEDGMLQLWSSNPELVVVGSVGQRRLPDFIRAVRAQHPEMRILALVPGSQAGELRPVLGSGADGVLARTVSTVELEDALRQVLSGKRVLTAAAVSVLVGRVEPTATPLATPLTSKDLQVLSLLGRGLANRQIADTLVLSMATVKSHLARIYGKLGAGNRQEAVGRAIEAGLLA